MSDSEVAADYRRALGADDGTDVGERSGVSTAAMLAAPPPCRSVHINSDIVFGLFAICGYQFSPRIADLTDSRMWLIDPAASYGILDQLARHRVRLDRVRSHWPDMLRVAGSLTTGQVRAYDLIRMICRDGHPTGLGEAFAHYGRIFKTLHILQVLHDESYRRMIGFQLNLHESRNALARRIRHGQHGQLRERYREGMEDQLGALGLVLNATVLWNTIYMDKARAQRQATGRPIPDQILESLGPLIFEHLNFSGRYPIQPSRARPAASRPHRAGGGRPLIPAAAALRLTSQR